MTSVTNVYLVLLAIGGFAFLVAEAAFLLASLSEKHQARKKISRVSHLLDDLAKYFGGR